MTTPFYATYAKFGALILALLFITMAVNYGQAGQPSPEIQCRCDE